MGGGGEEEWPACDCSLGLTEEQAQIKELLFIRVNVRLRETGRRWFEPHTFIQHTSRKASA